MSTIISSIYKRITSWFRQLPTFLKIIWGILVSLAGIFSCLFATAAFFHYDPFATPTPKTVSEVPPIGTLLYYATTPGPPGQHCDGGGGMWTIYAGAKVTCQDNQTSYPCQDKQISKQASISNTLKEPHLDGIFLKSIPGQSTFPSDYVIEVYLLQPVTSSVDFGIYFRNQPSLNNGTYTFLIHGDGSWSAYIYDNDTRGTRREIGKGQFGTSHVCVKVDVAVIGNSYTFYENGYELDQGHVTQNTYLTGTVGIAVDQGGTIFASNFAIYIPKE